MLKSASLVRELKRTIPSNERTREEKKRRRVGLDTFHRSIVDFVQLREQSARPRSFDSYAGPIHWKREFQGDPWLL